MTRLAGFIQIDSLKVVISSIIHFKLRAAARKLFAAAEAGEQSS